MYGEKKIQLELKELSVSLQNYVYGSEELHVSYLTDKIKNLVRNPFIVTCLERFRAGNRRKMS